MGEIRQFRGTIVENGVTWEFDPYTNSYCDYSEYDKESALRIEEEKNRFKLSYAQWVSEGVKVPFDKWDKRESRSVAARFIIKDKEEYRAYRSKATFKEFRESKYSLPGLMSDGVKNIVGDLAPDYKHGWKQFCEMRDRNG